MTAISVVLYLLTREIILLFQNQDQGSNKVALHKSQDGGSNIELELGSDYQGKLKL